MPNRNTQVAEFVRIRTRASRIVRNLTISATRSPRTSRRGWTLIEMLVTMSVVATMSGIAVQLLATLLRSERTGIDHVSRLSTTSRLSRVFRTDVHAATEFKIGPETGTTPLLQLTTQDSREIQYQAQPAGLLRIEKRSSGPVANELLRLNTTRFRCVESNGKPRRLTLIMETTDANPDTAKPVTKGRELHVEAVIGKDFSE